MKDYYQFIKRFFSNPSLTGSIFPSSQQLATGMIKKTSHNSPLPTRFLEVGAGSGAVTKHLIKKIGPNDRLDIVEIDEQFCHILKQKYSHLPNVSIYGTSILNFDHGEYDVLISSLPLNSLSAKLVDQILVKFKKLVKPDGYISFFEYMALSKVKMLYLSKKMQKDFSTVLSLKDSFIKSYCIEMDRVWWNFPPARVFHCKMKTKV